jgi:hypothetical protein
VFLPLITKNSSTPPRPTFQKRHKTNEQTLTTKIGTSTMIVFWSWPWRNRKKEITDNITEFAPFRWLFFNYFKLAWNREKTAEAVESIRMMK